MPAGDLRNRVGFYQRGANSPDVPDYGSGEEYPSTATFVTYAQIRPRLGGEQIIAGRLTGKNFVDITVRQSTETSAVDVDWKAKDEDSGVIYNIRSVIDPHQGDSDHGLWFEMLCEKGVAT
jgi:hypothetical protein